MKFFNSDKSGFLSFVAKRMKALFALFFIIAGTSSVWGQSPELSWTYASDMSGWADAVGKSEYTFIRQDVVFAGNNYTHYLDIEFQSAGTDNYKLIEDGNNWYGMESTIQYQCKWWEWKSGAGNTAFQHNAGRYRMYINADYDQRRVSVTGIIVTIDQPVQNADGSYTITGRFTNANPGQQNIYTYQIVFSEGKDQGVGANEPATVGEDGSFSITKQLVEGQQYTCCARAIDGSIGNHDSEYITFTAAATPEPEPTVTDLYIFGVDNNWSNPSDEWKCTSVSQDGNVYTWDWPSPPKTFNGGTYFKVGAKNAENTGIDDNNNYGPSGSDTTLDFNGVQSIVQTVVNSSQSKAFTVSSATEIYKIEFNKSALTVTFYAPVEAPDPVTPTADSYVVTWAEPVYDAEAGTVVLSATVAAAENAGFTLDQASGLHAQINVQDGANSGLVSLPNGDGQYEVSHTVTGVQAGSTVNYSLQIVTGGGNPLVNPSDVPNLNPQTYTVPEAEPEPEPVSLYLIGAGTGAQWILADALPFTYENGVYTWTGELTVNNEAFKILTSNTGWEPAYVAETNQFEVVLGEAIVLHYREKTGDNQYTWGDNKFKITEDGEYTIKVTLGGDNSGSMIVTKKSDPVYAATITADASASQGTARQVVLTSSLTETSAGADLSAATCQFQYLSADAAEGTEYSNLDDPVAYNAEGASLTTTALPQGGKYLFRAVWTLNDEVVATSDPSEATCVYPIWPEPEMFDVVWIPTYNTSDGSVTITAEISAKEDACFVMGQIVGLVANIFVDDASQATSMSNPSGAENNKATATATIQNVNEGQELAYRLELTTGANQQVLGRGGIQIPGGTYVVEGEAYVERFPVTVNKVNGENGSVDTVPSDITNMAIGETVTVTATANEGYVALFEATSGCVMTDGSADNIKVFEITEANPVITVTFQVQCETVEPRFTISGRFNAGVTDGDWLYQGTAVESGDDDPKDGYWSDGARYIQLTANSVTANYFEWKCTGYAIDGAAQEAVPEISWTDKDKTSARAELSKPGTYTFVCKAKCNETDEWTNSKELTITAPAPEMGFDGTGIVGSAWDHASAGIDGQGLMTRQPGTMIWKSRVLNVANFGGEFVVIQRYKTLGCNDFSENSSDESSRGWTGNGECGDMGLTRSDNKVNRAETLQFMNVEQPGDDANFKTANGGNWTAGENGTDLQLVVTMTGWDSYTVALEEVAQECTTPADNFAISARLNQGAGAPFEGNLVASDSNTATGGYFTDGFRTVTLSTTQVADTYEWKLVGYAIDGSAQATADLTALATITNGDAQTATALLSLPGDYTFQCTAACTDGTPVNSATVTISTYPEMGFDGPIGTPASVSENGWNHAWAGQSGNGLLVRENGSLKWSLTFVYQGVGSTPNDFVVIQRYKRGCVTAPDGGEQGWAGFTECGVIVPGEPDFWGNKINASIIDLASGLGYASTTEGDNFRADDLAAEQGWVAGVTELTLTVTMTGWDIYTVELAKKQEQIYANYSSNNEAMGTVAMKVGDTSIANGADITGYIGEQVTLTATPAQGYKVASWEINGKVTESDRTTISPTLSGAGLNVVVTFERDCYSGIVYDLTGGGVICADGGSTELSLNTLNNVKYQLYNDGVAYGTAVEGNGEAAKWTISEEGTYTAKAYDSRFEEECQAQAIDMNGSAVVTTVTAPKITVNPGVNVHLTVLQARSFTADVPVDWSITDVSSEGGYCDGDGYMISSKTDTSLVAKFLCIGTAKITATMKAHNRNCKAEVTVHQNGAENELCAPEPEDVQ